MDDIYAINVAKTEFREAFNTADPDRLVSLLDTGFVDFSDGRTCAFGQGAAVEMREHLKGLFRDHQVHLSIIMIEIRIVGEVGYDYGWHNFTLTPKQGGAPIERHERYVDIWKKNADGKWKLWMYMDNRDVPQQMVTAGDS
jgi:ketosteroid isomerase-like protein